MRKILSLAIAMLAGMCNLSYAGTVIAQTQLPKEARNFIAKYFAADKVRKVEKDQGHRGWEYEVDFTSGAEAEFRDNGTWKEVKAARGRAVSAAIVPSAIAKYVSTKYAGQSIIKIARKRGGYELKLSGGAELKLTQDAKPFTGGQGRGGRSARK